MITATNIDKNGKAIELLRKALALAPENAVIHERLSALYIQTGQKQEAVERLRFLSEYYQREQNFALLQKSLEKLVDVQPDDIPGLERLADLYEQQNMAPDQVSVLETLLEIHVRKGHPEKASSICETILNQDPSRGDIRHQLIEIQESLGSQQEVISERKKLAQSLYDEKNYRAALQQYEEILQSAPKDIDSLEQSVSLLVQLGQMDEAAVKALKIAAEFEKADDLDRAVMWYRKATEIRPDNSRAWERLGRALEKTDEANDSVISAYELAADLLIAEKAEGSALQLLEHIFDIQPDHVKSRQLRVQILKSQNKTREAIQEMVALADLLKAENDIEGATKVYEEAVSESPDSLAIAFQLGQLYLEKDRKEDFCHLYEKLAGQKRAQGKPTEAIDLFKHILQIDSGRTDMRLMLAESYQATGELESAAGEFSTVAKQFSKEAARAKDDSGRESYLGRARQAYGKAIECSPESVQLQGELIEFEAASGDRNRIPRIIDNFVEKSFSLLQSDEPVERKNLLKNLQGLVETGKDLLSDSAELLETESRLLEGFGEKTAAGESLIAAGEKRQKAGDYSRAYEDYRSALGRLPDDDNPLVKILQLSQIEENIERAVETAWSLATRYRAKGATESLEAMLDVIKEYNPEDIQVVQWRINAAVESERMQDAVAVALESADMLISNDKVRDALVISRETVEKVPDSIQLSEKIYWCLEQLGDNQAAIQEGLALAQAYAEKDPLRAIERYEDLVKLDPDNTVIRKTFAEYLEEQGKPSEALEQWLPLVSLYSETGLSEKAIEILRRLREAFPDNLKVRYRLLDLLESENMHHSAAQEGLALLSIIYAEERETKDLQASRSLAERVLRNRPDLEEAIEIYTRILFQLGEKDLYVQHKIHQANLARERDDLQQSIACLQEAVERFPENETLSNSLEEVREQSLKLEKKSTVTQRLEKANKALFAGDTEKALSAMESLRAEEPGNLEVAQALGRAYGKAGKTDAMLATFLDISDAYRDKKATGQALKTLYSIVEVDPDFIPALERMAELEKETAPERAVESYLRLGEITSKRGDFDHSAEYFTFALALRPDNPSALDMLGETLWKQIEKEVELGSVQSLQSGRKGLDSLVNLQCSAALLNEKRHQTESSEILSRVRQRAEALALAIGENTGSEWESLSYEVWGREQASREKLVAFLLAHSRSEEALELEMSAAERFMAEGRISSAQQTLEHLLESGLENIAIRKAMLDILVKQYDEIRQKDSEQVIFNDSMVVMHTPSAREQELASEIVQQRFALAQLYEKSGAVDDATVQYEESIKMPGSHIEAREKLVDLYFGKDDVEAGIAQLTVLANSYREKELWGKVLELYQRALEKVPENRALVLEIGRIYAQQGLESKSVRLLRHTGDVDWGKGDFIGAIECYQEALKVEPNNVTVLAKLARGYLETDNSDRARESFNTLMDVYSERGLFSRAQQIFEKDIADFSQYEELWRFLAKQWQRKHHSEMAVQLLECLKKHRPKANVGKQLELLRESKSSAGIKKTPQMGAGLGRGFRTSHHPDETVGGSSRGQSQKGILAQVRTNYERRRYSIALTQLQEMLTKSKRESQPDDLVEIYDLAGQCHLQLKEYDKAIEQFTKGSTISGANPQLLKEIRYNLAQAYEQNSQLAQAVELWKEIYSIDPNFRDIKTKILSMHLRKKSK